MDVVVLKSKNRLPFCIACLHLHGALGVQRKPFCVPHLGAKVCQPQTGIWKCLPAAGKFPSESLHRAGGGVFGKRLFKLLSAPGAAPFHPLPLRKDVLGKDFKVLLSKGKSHLESFSQKEKETNYLI